MGQIDNLKETFYYLFSYGKMSIRINYLEAELRNEIWGRVKSNAGFVTAGMFYDTLIKTCQEG